MPCIEPNGDRADTEYRLAKAAANRGDTLGAALHLTAAAYLTPGRAAARRGVRALGACQAWIRAQRPRWAHRLARSFTYDICLKPAVKRQLRALANSSGGLGRSFPAGSPVFVNLQPQDIGRAIHFRVGRRGTIQGPY